jgi:hypothetical protein
MSFCEKNRWQQVRLDLIIAFGTNDAGQCVQYSGDELLSGMTEVNEISALCEIRQPTSR